MSEKLNGSNRRHKLNSKIKIEPITKSEPSDENDSSLPNKENNNCSGFENCATVKPNLKAEKFPNHEAVGNLNEKNNKSGMEAGSTEGINDSHCSSVVTEKICDTEEKSDNNENCYGIYEEHNYVILDTENNNTDVPDEDHRKCTWSETKINQTGYELQQEKQEKIKEESAPCDKAPTADLGKFMMAETLCDMVSSLFFTCFFCVHCY
jgi:hypothetical protein